MKKKMNGAETDDKIALRRVKYFDNLIVVASKDTLVEHRSQPARLLAKQLGTQVVSPLLC